MACLKFCLFARCVSFSRLESKVQKLESQQKGELEDMREEKNRLQVHSIKMTSVCFTVKQHHQRVSVWTAVCICITYIIA